jgi:hypothetical protein
MVVKTNKAEEISNKLYPEEDGWETIQGLDNLFRPENIGDTVKGVYVKHESDVGINHSEVYTLEEENEEDPENPIIHVVYGTTDLNNKFERIDIGMEVGIVYKGEKPAKPPHKPFKMFEVKKRGFASEDDVDNSTMGDPEAVKRIDEICDALLLEDITPTEELIKARAKEWHLAKQEGYKNPKILAKIETQLNLRG